MKHLKIYENDKENNKKTCEAFISFATDKFSHLPNFVKIYNDSKHYDDYDDLFYVFDGVNNEANNKETDIQFIMNYMKEIGWWDINFQISPMMENNKLYVYFVLGHSYEEMEEIVMKNNMGKYNI